MIPKKDNAKENYRIMSLISHKSKILINIIKNRIKNKVENNIGDDKFGFRPGKGARKLFHALRVLLERKMDINKSTYIVFVDIQKTFDRLKKIV